MDGLINLTIWWNLLILILIPQTGRHGGTMVIDLEAMPDPRGGAKTNFFIDILKFSMKGGGRGWGGGAKKEIKQNHANLCNGIFWIRQGYWDQSMRWCKYNHWGKNKTTQNFKKCIRDAKKNIGISPCAEGDMGTGTIVKRTRRFNKNILDTIKTIGINRCAGNH